MSDRVGLSSSREFSGYSGQSVQEPEFLKYDQFSLRLQLRCSSSCLQEKKNSRPPWC